MTALPNPFLSASDGLHPLSSVAVTPLAPPALGVTAEISSAESLSAGPAIALTRPAPDPDAMAGANSSLGVVASSGTDQRLEIDPRNAGYFPGPAASGAVWHGENGCSEPAPPCDLTRPSQFNPSMTMEEPQDAPAAVQSPLNLAETAGASGPLIELHEFLGTGILAPAPLGPWPRGFDAQAFLRAIEEAWVAGIDHPEPPLFLETFKLGEVA